MRKFHALTVSRIERETPDSLRIGLSVPDELREEYRFLPGQHVPVEVDIDGRRVRRTYSLCSVPGRMPLEMGIRVQEGGAFSGFVAEHVKAGDALRVMPPIGQFHATIDPGTARNYLALAAGSGITPILSIVGATLEYEPESRVVLFYGNRSQQTTMFIDELYALKNRFPERLQLHFLFSREEQEFPIMTGRLDAAKIRELYGAFCASCEPDEVFVCGPDTMIATAIETLVALGVDAGRIHAERFGAPRQSAPTGAARRKAADSGNSVRVTVVMDGHRRTFGMAEDGDNLVDAAAAEGIELPYSCKGGVCATCRTFLQEGDVRMRNNYGLEPWEVERGYILACQSEPRSAELTIDYDRT